MGIAHILWVYEDGLTHHDRGVLAPAVGEAVVDLCMNPIMTSTPEGLRPLRSRPVLNHGNCINKAAELRSVDEQIFVWAGNCLRPLYDLDNDGLDRAKALFDALYRGLTHYRPSGPPIQ